MENEFTLRASTTEKSFSVDAKAQNLIPLTLESTSQVFTDGVGGALERVDIEDPQLPDWITLSNKVSSANGYVLLFYVHENTGTEARATRITLTQLQSGKTLYVEVSQAAPEPEPEPVIPPEPVINYLSYHVDHLRSDDQYDYYDVYFQSENPVESTVTLEVSIDSLGQATGYSFIINAGETRSPKFEMQANKGVLGELGLLEVISIDPTEDDVYQYKVNI